MKKLLKLVALLGLVAGVLWMLRDQLIPGPTAPSAHPPPFRHPPEPAMRAQPTPAATVDDLTVISGIGPVYAGKLADAGVRTLRALADADADGLAADSGIARERVADWIEKAADLA